MGDIGVGLTKTRSAIKDQLNVPEGALMSVFPRLVFQEDRKNAYSSGVLKAAFAPQDFGSKATRAFARSGKKSGPLESKVNTVSSAKSDLLQAFAADPLQKVWNAPYGERVLEYRSMNSRYGIPIIRGSSNIRAGGNIIWMDDIDERIIIKSIPFEEDKVNADTYLFPNELYYREYHYYASFAIAFADTMDTFPGKIVRLWADGQIIWDIRDVNTSEPAQLVDIRNRKYLPYSHYMDSVTIVYNGTTDNTLADGTMSASLGEGNVPGYKGITYAVFNNLDLNLFGRKIPIIQAEISFDASSTILGRGFDHEDSYLTTQLAWQHYTTDQYKLGSSGQYWLDVDIYAGTGIKGPTLWQYDEVGADSGKVSDIGDSSSNFRVDKWGNGISFQGPWQPFYYGNSAGHAIYKRTSGVSAVLNRIFNDEFWFPPDHDDNSSFTAVATGASFIGIHRNPAPLHFQYIYSDTNPGYAVYSQIHLTDPFNHPELELVSVAAKAIKRKSTGIVFGSPEFNFSNLSTGTIVELQVFGRNGPATSCYVPEFENLFLTSHRNLNIETLIHYRGISGFTDSITNTDSTYDKWNYFTNDEESAVTLNTSATPSGSIFSDLGQEGKILVVSRETTHIKYKFDVAVLENNATLFETPGTTVETIVEVEDSTSGLLQASQFTYSQGLQHNRLCGIVPHTAGEVLDIGWGFYDVGSMSRVDETYNQSEAIQIVGEAPIAAAVNNGGADYLPAIYGVLGHPFLGTSTPTFWLFRYANNWQTLDQVILRLLFPYIEYIDTSDIDVTDLASIAVKGYIIGEPANITEYVKRLQDVYLFNVVETDSKLVFKRRGQGDSVIPISDVLLDTDTVYTTKNIIDLAKNAKLKYIDYNLDFLASSQIAKVIDRLPIGEMELVTPVVFDKDEAVQRIDVLLKVSHAESNGITMLLSRKYSYLLAGDIISFDVYDRIRLTKVDHNTDGSVSVAGVNESLVAYSSTAVGETVADFKSKILSTSKIEVIPIEVPYVTTSDSAVGKIYYAGYQRFSTDAVNLYVHTDGTRFTNIGSIPSTTTIAKVLRCTHVNMDTVTSYLQPARETQREGVFDHSLELEVYHVFGNAPTSGTKGDVFKGLNVLAIGNELVGFLNAELVAINRYKLTGLLRGIHSTYNKIDTHVSGEHAVEFRNLPSIGYTEAELDSQLNIFGVINNRFSEEYIDAANTGVSFTPLEVANIEITKSVNDIVITWDRKNRYEGRMTSGSDIPAGDTTYKVEINDYRDNTVVRTFDSLSSETVTYTSAQQVTDFGVNQDNVSIKLYAVNLPIGDGRPTLTSSEFFTSEHIRHFKDENLGVATNLIGINNGDSFANVVATRSSENALEIGRTSITNTTSNYYYILDDLYNVNNKSVTLEFRFDKFNKANGSVLRIAFEAVDKDIVNYIEINESNIKYFLYTDNGVDTLTTKTVSIPTLAVNTWYRFTGSLINNVFNIKEIVEPQYRYEPKVLINELPYVLPALFETPILTLGGGIGIGNNNVNIVTQVKYIKVI